MNTSTSLPKSARKTHFKTLQVSVYNQILTKLRYQRGSTTPIRAKRSEYSAAEPEVATNRYLVGSVEIVLSLYWACTTSELLCNVRFTDSRRRQTTHPLLCRQVYSTLDCLNSIFVFHQELVKIKELQTSFCNSIVNAALSCCRQLLLPSDRSFPEMNVQFIRSHFLVDKNHKMCATIVERVTQSYIATNHRIKLSSMFSLHRSISQVQLIKTVMFFILRIS